jgi:hypothetical protein
MEDEGRRKGSMGKKKVRSSSTAAAAAEEEERQKGSKEARSGGRAPGFGEGTALSSTMR